LLKSLIETLTNKHRDGAAMIFLVRKLEIRKLKKLNLRSVRIVNGDVSLNKIWKIKIFNGTNDRNRI